MKEINLTGLYFKGLEGDKEEHPCNLMVLQTPNAASYDRGIRLSMFCEETGNMVPVDMPILYAQRFCSMVETQEYLSRDFWHFNECNSVNYWMMVSWLVLAAGQDPCYQSFGFGQSVDGRFVLMVYRDPGRYSPGLGQPPVRYLAYLSESDLVEVVKEIVSVLAALTLEGEGEHHDS